MKKILIAVPNAKMILTHSLASSLQSPEVDGKERKERLSENFFSPSNH